MKMGIFDIPYRWTWRTILPILGHCWYSVRHGIVNIFRWIPVIWHDEDFDWEYLASVMEWKLRRMSRVFQKHGHHLFSDRDARRTLICAELLKRIRQDEWLEPITRSSVHRHSTRMKEWQEMLGKIIGKHLTGWWD